MLFTAIPVNPMKGEQRFRLQLAGDNDKIVGLSALDDELRTAGLNLNRRPAAWLAPARAALERRNDLRVSAAQLFGVELQHLAVVRHESVHFAFDVRRLGVDAAA